MTPEELKYYLQKEILKLRLHLSTMYLCDCIGCSYHSLESFLRSRSNRIPVALQVVCYLINEGVIQLKEDKSFQNIELKGGVQNE